MSAEPIERLLYHECGLKGLSGHQQRHARPAGQRRPAAPGWRSTTSSTASRRELGCWPRPWAASTARVHRRHRRERRRRSASAVCRALAWLGARARRRRATPATGRASRRRRAGSPACVIPTDEERMIARHTLRRCCGRTSASAQGEATHDRPRLVAAARGQARRLVTGIANDQSIAWGCAKAFRGARRRAGGHLSQREGEALRRAAGPEARGADLDAARRAAPRASSRRCSSASRGNGAGSTSPCTRSPSRRRPTCRAASSTARGRAS